MAAREKISKENVKKLKEHPYVVKATEWTISFTAEFKRIAYEEYSSGKSMREIFRDAGFDVEMLGEKRLQNFRNNLVKKALPKNLNLLQENLPNLNLAVR